MRQVPNYPDVVIKTGADYDPRRRKVAAQPVIQHGVAIGPDGGCIFSAKWHPDGRIAVTGLVKTAPKLGEIGGRIVQLLADDPNCRILADGGLHGADLKAFLRNRRVGMGRLTWVDATRPELRRAEYGGTLRAAWERGDFSLPRLGSGSLAGRGAIFDASREDAGERVEVVALSLAVAHKRRVPSIG